MPSPTRERTAAQLARWPFTLTRLTRAALGLLRPSRGLELVRCQRPVPGCPLNNPDQQMSLLDDGFRARRSAISNPRRAALRDAAGGGYAIHDAVLSEQGIGLVSNLLTMVARPGQEPFTQLG